MSETVADGGASAWRVSEIQGLGVESERKSQKIREQDSQSQQRGKECKENKMYPGVTTRKKDFHAAYEKETMAASKNKHVPCRTSVPGRRRRRRAASPSKPQYSTTSQSSSGEKGQIHDMQAKRRFGCSLNAGYLQEGARRGRECENTVLLLTGRLEPSRFVIFAN